MEIVGPVIGIGAIISFVVAGIAVVRRLPPASRGHHLESDERQLLDDVQARLGELEQLTQRIGELEERVDFSERVLGQLRERQQLGPPSADRE